MTRIIRRVLWYVVGVTIVMVSAIVSLIAGYLLTFPASVGFAALFDYLGSMPEQTGIIFTPTPSEIWVANWHWLFVLFASMVAVLIGLVIFAIAYRRHKKKFSHKVPAV